MARPPWIDVLRERFLADAGNLFLIVGADADDEQALLSFLVDRRDVVGTLDARGALSFPAPGHAATFERTLKATAALDTLRPLSTGDDLESVLGRIQIGLAAPATTQGWVLRGADGLPVEALRGWAAALADTNHLVVCLTAEARVPCLELDAACRIDAHPPEPVPEEAPDLEHVDRMLLAFALRTCRQITEADGVLCLSELELLVRVFPDDVLREAGFLGTGGELTPAAEAAYTEALAEAHTLPRDRTLTLLQLFRDACMVDGRLHPREEAVLRRAARVLGLDHTDVVRVLD